jgi:hypothetical protein
MVSSAANHPLAHSYSLGVAMSEPDVLESQERVRRMLRQAFAEVPCPSTFKEADDCGPLSHDVSLELRRDFYNYEFEEIHYLLPMILEDMMDTRTGDDIETDDAERLVLQLDPFWLDEAGVRKVKLEQFANFTPEQAQAVCEWLRFARAWNDLKRFTDWVDAAIRYWCRNPTDNTEGSRGSG